MSAQILVIACGGCSTTDSRGAVLSTAAIEPPIGGPGTARVAPDAIVRIAQGLALHRPSPTSW